ncbi:MAG: hypothetical protein R2705_16585 [Ilumatobacteraceae bacterium]
MLDQVCDRGARHPSPIVRRYRDTDREAVVRCFLDTLLLGEPLPHGLANASGYATLCLGWFLDHEPHAAHVAVDPGTGRVVGYALLATDGAAARRWARRQCLRFAVTTAPRLMSPGWSRSRAFYAARARDVLGNRTRRRRGVGGARARLGLGREHLDGALIRRMLHAVDQTCLEHGLAGFSTEIDARRDVRPPWVRLGFELVDETSNRTLSDRLGTAVDRFTAVRRLGDQRGSTSRTASGTWEMSSRPVSPR